MATRVTISNKKMINISLQRYLISSLFLSSTYLNAGAFETWIPDIQVASGYSGSAKSYFNDFSHFTGEFYIPAMNDQSAFEERTCQNWIINKQLVAQDLFQLVAIMSDPEQFSVTFPDAENYLLITDDHGYYYSTRTSIECLHQLYDVKKKISSKKRFNAVFKSPYSIVSTAEYPEMILSGFIRNLAATPLPDMPYHDGSDCAFIYLIHPDVVFSQCGLDDDKSTGSHSQSGHTSSGSKSQSRKRVRQSCEYDELTWLAKELCEDFESEDWSVSPEEKNAKGLARRGEQKFKIPVYPYGKNLLMRLMMGGIPEKNLPSLLGADLALTYDELSEIYKKMDLNPAHLQDFHECLYRRGSAKSPYGDSAISVDWCDFLLQRNRCDKSPSSQYVKDLKNLFFLFYWLEHQEYEFSTASLESFSPTLASWSQDFIDNLSNPPNCLVEQLFRRFTHNWTRPQRVPLQTEPDFSNPL